jgi:histidyl-tRNA synthetase
MQSVRGTKDYFGEDAAKFDHIVQTAKNAANLFGFESFYTPIFEDTSVFTRTLGETSDVVNKEMYTFESKGGESLTLRPEFTAGIARAFISNGLQQNLPLKLFSYGPLFRYERPQKGRQRQFHQINFECLGIKDFAIDVEMISLAASVLKNLGITKNVTLNINTLGDKISRENYLKALVEYLTKFSEKLSEDSKNRLQKNPLRILDSKDAGDREILQNAPKIQDYLTPEAAEFFNNVVDGVKQIIEFPVEVNPNIVRGLDYYNHTVFEFIASGDELGSQNTILAGGRYDNLITQMGGPETPAFGFAAGIERLMLMISAPQITANKIAIIADDNISALKNAAILRAKNIPCEIIISGNFKKKIQRAIKANASHILFVFPDGLEIKNLATQAQEKTDLNKVVEIFSTNR